MSQKKFFYGWVIVGTLCLVNMVPIVLIANYASFFQMPVSEALGVTYAEFAIGSMTGSIGGILFSLFMAGKLGRGNMRVWMGTCMLIAAICEFGMSFMTAIWQYWMLQFIMMFAFTGCMFLPINTLLARWFVDKKGLATGIVYAGAGVGGMVFSPLLKMCIETVGWRMSYVYIAIATAVFAVIVFLLIRNKPDDVGQTPLVKKEPATAEGEAAQAADEASVTMGLTRAEAIRTPSMWFMVLVMFCGGIMSAAATSQLPTFVTENMGDYALVMVFYSFGTIFAKFILGPIFDAKGFMFGSTTIVLLSVLSMFGLLLFPEYGIVFACAGALLLAFNCVPSFIGALGNGKLFGYIAFADCYGLLNIAYLLGCMVGPTITATIRTISGSYMLAWIVLIIVTLLIEVGVIFALKLGKNLPAKWHS